MDKFGGITEKTNAAMSRWTDGAKDAYRIHNAVKTFGALETAQREVDTERDYVMDSDSNLDLLRRAGQSGGRLVGVMLTITLAAAIGFVGIKVTSEIDDSIETTAGTNYDNASTSISEGFADAMGLTDIVFLVLMFSVILGALLAFRGA